ncbi:hypothetical protein NM208_g10358 [Fusarium decemcellulare]|uniref:Uncharacterized protein n=1 Tax=Fusarium decemcellulare TaxID=57161 RepID=A0ACC1RY86_9HYPO|nr:hypothetical protein NM208_g10358 [Fusarium decemcellulare]
MDAPALCTICGSSDGRLCITCQSAAYCSVECQQTDWHAHRLLCRKFPFYSQDNYASRPSPAHYLGICFPMGGPRPYLMWVRCQPNDDVFEPFIHPVLDDFLPVDRRTGRGLRQVEGNILRGREINRNTLHLWFLEPLVDPHSLIVNQTIHAPSSTLTAGTWGEFLWEGPIVAVMRAGNAKDSGYEPRKPTDITLTAYRDAIDYLCFYRDTIGSMIDGIGTRAHLAKTILADWSGKAIGVRINCRRDQVARNEPQMIEVAVPKNHPLFNVEGDDPCEIPDLFGLRLVAKPYNGKSGDEGNVPPADDLDNPLARLLLTTINTKNGQWTGLSRRWSPNALGSVLFIDHSGQDLRMGEISKLCDFIEEIARPFVLTEDASDPSVATRFKRVLLEEGSRRGIQYY